MLHITTPATLSLLNPEKSWSSNINREFAGQDFRLSYIFLTNKGALPCGLFSFPLETCWKNFILPSNLKPSTAFVRYHHKRLPSFKEKQNHKRYQGKPNQFKHKFYFSLSMEYQHISLYKQNLFLCDKVLHNCLRISRGFKDIFRKFIPGILKNIPYLLEWAPRAVT